MTSNGYKEIKIGIRDFTIPIDWEVLDIENTSTLKGRIGWQGLTTKEYLNKGNFYLITGTDFKNGRIYWDNCHYVEKERYQQDSNIQIKEKDVLITKDGTIGKVALIDRFPSHPATLNSGVFVLRPIENSYLPEYMYHYLKSYFFKSFINDIKAGSTIAHLYQKDFNKFQFICPPTIKEQQKIAEILSTVDETIEKTTVIIEETRQLKKGLMQKLFTEGIGHIRFKETKIGRIPEEWEVVRFHKCLNKAMHKDPSIMPEEEFTYIDVSAVSNKLYKITDSKRLLGKNAPGRARKEVKHGDTIYATVRPYLKRIAYISEEFDKEICSTGYCVLHPNVDFVEPKFVFQLMLTHKVNQYLKSLQVGTAYPAINDSDIYQMLIPLPTQNEQNKISTILSEVDAKIEKEEATKAELEQLKKGLMQVLLTGKVRVKVEA